MADNPALTGRRRCNAEGPKRFQRCGRWKGHDGPHREMCGVETWDDQLTDPKGVMPSASTNGVHATNTFTITLLVPRSILNVMKTEAAIDGMEAREYSAAGVQQFVAGYFYSALRGLSPVSAEEFKKLNKDNPPEEDLAARLHAVTQQFEAANARNLDLAGQLAFLCTHDTADTERAAKTALLVRLQAVMQERDELKRRVADWEPLKAAFMRRIDFECDRSEKAEARLAALTECASHVL